MKFQVTDQFHDLCALHGIGGHQCGVRAQLLEVTNDRKGLGQLDAVHLDRRHLPHGGADEEFLLLARWCLYLFEFDALLDHECLHEAVVVAHAKSVELDHHAFLSFPRPPAAANARGFEFHHKTNARGAHRPTGRGDFVPGER